MIGINLLPDVKKEFIKTQRTRNMVVGVSIIAMFIAVGATVALALVVLLVQNGLIAVQRGNVKDHQKTLASKTEIGKYLTIQNQLDTLKVLHGKDSKSIYSRLFDYLVTLNPAAPNNVGLSDVKVDRLAKTIALQGSAKDFKTLDIFKNTLEKAMLNYTVDGEKQEESVFRSVDMKSAVLSDANGKPIVSFEFELEYIPSAFEPGLANAQLVVPRQVVSDSQANAPSQLFSETGSSQ